MGVVISLLFMGIFTYVATQGQMTYYVYQVGIYKETDNKDSKMQELEEEGMKGYFYIKDDQYYVLSMITLSQDEIRNHSSQMKGIIKKYVVSKNTTVDKLLTIISKGD